jgi:serine/threonine-protein kinase
MSDEHFEKRIGTVLKGKWTLERLLGVGGMAAVYVGAHRIGRRDAIKIMHPEVARSKDLRARFDQEAHAVNRLTHPGAVQIRDIDSDDDGSMFLVMELLEGEPLSDRAQRLGSLPIDEVLEHAERVLDVLAAAHEVGIIHRDIKPDNVFITNDGNLKVLDFGIAQVRRDAAKSMLTRPGSTLGTVSYMPPEQVKGIPVDCRADLFAVGAMMFRLLARRRIHEARSESELMVKMASEPAPPLQSVAAHVPPHVCTVVDLALAFDRERRYPSALTMRADVQAVRRGEAPPYAVSVPSQPPPAPMSATGTDRTAATAMPGMPAPALSDRTEQATVAPVNGGAATRADASNGLVPASTGVYPDDWTAAPARRATAATSWLVAAAAAAITITAMVWWMVASPADEELAGEQSSAGPRTSEEQSEKQRELDKGRQKAADKQREKERKRLEKDREKQRDKDD